MRDKSSRVLAAVQPCHTDTDEPVSPQSPSEIQLLGIDSCIAIGEMSRSWWHAEVASGRAPQPVIRRPRCTRWQASSVYEFWRRFAQSGTEEADKLMATTRRASDAARAKRSAKKAG